MMATEWTIETIRIQPPRTIPVLFEGQVVDAEIVHDGSPADTTLLINGDYYGTNWAAVVDSLNSGVPLEVIPDADKPSLTEDAKREL